MGVCVEEGKEWNTSPEAMIKSQREDNDLPSNARLVRAGLGLTAQSELVCFRASWCFPDSLHSVSHRNIQAAASSNDHVQFGA